MFQVSPIQFIQLGFIGTLLGLLLAGIITDIQELIIIALCCAFIKISWDAVTELWHGKIGSELFFVIATIIGTLAGQYTATLVIVLVLLIADFLADMVQSRTEYALEKLLRLMPSKVTVLLNGQQRELSIDKITSGMHILIITGGRIAVDGYVIDGEASVNESALTGESALIEKTKNSKVFAGTFVEAGSIVVQAEYIGQQTIFGKISELLAQAEQQKAKIIGIADKFAVTFSIAILIFALIIWWWTRNLTTVITLLVFGSPTELVLITPLSILAGIAASFRHGILVKGGIALETLAQADTLIFDKTGTLTQGKPTVQSIVSLDPSIPAEEIIAIAASAEQYGGHVLAQALRDYAQEHNIAMRPTTNYKSLAGHGISAYVDNIPYLIGNYHFITSPEHGNIPLDATTLKTEVNPAFFIATNKQVIGVITIIDPIRPSAKKAITQLRDLGINNIVMLTGDRKIVAQHVAQKIGITEFMGEQFPDQKVAYIQRALQQGHTVTMIGDGINDAPALKTASVGIAMGSMGMEPAIAAADIVLIGTDLTKLPILISISRKVFSTIKQNIWFGLIGIHGFGIVAALLGLVTPVQAALIHGISDIVIVLNSARIIKFGK